MCGIAGIIAYTEEAPPVDREELLRIREHMIRRGPDGAGLWMSTDGRAGLAHRRLAIIDLSEAGAQPMSTADGRYRITFNGEIYNFRELRRALKAKGFVFRSDSDTEVLLHLYAERGAEMVHALRGMFAFGIWDEREKTLFLARDPFGIKPLYYADDGRTFRFASQVKALLKGGQIASDPDPGGAAGFLIFGSVPEPFTTYRAVRRVRAGTTLTVARGGAPVESSYFSVRDELAAAQEASADLGRNAERLAGALARSVRDHLVADVPVGVFLSSGIDSAIVAGLAAGASELHTLTVGFDEYRGTDNDETRHSESVAARLSARHDTSWIGRDDFLRDMQDILEAMDQPSIDGVNTYLVSKAAAQRGLKVALSGLGGDELFAGYSTFREVPRLVRALRLLPFGKSFGRAVRGLLAGPIGSVTSPKYAGVLEYGGSYPGAYLLRRSLFMPWELDDLLESNAVREGIERLNVPSRMGDSIRGLRSPRSRIAALEMQWYLRNQLLVDADWAGMAHSLEIRTPLVDRELFRAAAPFIAGAAPYDKRQVARALGETVPAEVTDRRKSGFSVPVREWLAQESGISSRRRGLRGWALKVGKVRPPRRVLALVTDGFGGTGGIALYTRDLLYALCSLPDCAEVAALPRLMPNAPGPMPEKLAYRTDALGGKRRYVLALVRELMRWKIRDVIVCSHLNLLPLARAAKWVTGAPLVLLIYGIEAWSRPGSRLVRGALNSVDRIGSISRVTADRFASWSSWETGEIDLLPNAIHLDWYAPGQRNEALVRRYDLPGKKVIGTVGRLASSEGYKGFDEVLDVLPGLLEAEPGVRYLIVGEGTDRPRLERKARQLGVANRVIFTGFVPEAEKPDYYRLMDVHVMPSRGEGFGFVLLEAMACGIPVIGSKLDGTREALRDGLLGELVDPARPEELRAAIMRGLAGKSREVPAGLEYFSFPNFTRRVHAFVEGAACPHEPGSPTAAPRAQPSMRRPVNPGDLP